MSNKITYSYMGGKARITEWLLEHFPYEGRNYIEPFAGKGNVYFAAVQRLSYQRWLLNDKYTVPFFEAILQADLGGLPETLESDHEFILPNTSGHIPLLLESVVSYGGKGYKSSGCRIDWRWRYDKQRLIDKFLRSRSFLRKAQITSYDWREFLAMFSGWLPGEQRWETDEVMEQREFKPGLKLSDQDFIYFDPPYWDTKSSYPQINHHALISYCNWLSEFGVRWAISGYDNFVYEDNLEYMWKYQIERNVEMTSINGELTPSIETLWTNY